MYRFEFYMLSFSLWTLKMWKGLVNHGTGKVNLEVFLSLVHLSVWNTDKRTQNQRSESWFWRMTLVTLAVFLFQSVLKVSLLFVCSADADAQVLLALSSNTMKLLPLDFKSYKHRHHDENVTLWATVDQWCTDPTLKSLMRFLVTKTTLAIWAECAGWCWEKHYGCHVWNNWTLHDNCIDDHHRWHSSWHGSFFRRDDKLYNTGNLFFSWVL